jgi:hypothetical protein
MTCPDCNTTHVTNRDACGQPLHQLCSAVVQRRVPEAAEARAERAVQRLVRRLASDYSPGFSVTSLVRRRRSARRQHKSPIATKTA